MESVHSGVPFLAVLQYSLRKSTHSLSFSFIFFHFSFSFIVFPFFCHFFFSSSSFSFSRVLRILSSFLPRLPHDFLLKLLCKKSFFGAVSGVPQIGPPLFSLVYFSFFQLRFLFQFLSMLCLFSFVFPLFIFLFFAGDCLRPGSAEFRESLLGFVVAWWKLARRAQLGTSLVDREICRTTIAC